MYGWVHWFFELDEVTAVAVPMGLNEQPERVEWTAAEPRLGADPTGLIRFLSHPARRIGTPKGPTVAGARSFGARESPGALLNQAGDPEGARTGASRSVKKTETLDQ